MTVHPVIGVVPLLVTVRDAVNPVPQSVCTLYAALHDEVAAAGAWAVAGDALAAGRVAPAVPTAPSKAAAVSVTLATTASNDLWIGFRISVLRSRGWLECPAGLTGKRLHTRAQRKRAGRQREETGALASRQIKGRVKVPFRDRAATSAFAACRPAFT